MNNKAIAAKLTEAISALEHIYNYSSDEQESLRDEIENIERQIDALRFAYGGEK